MANIVTNAVARTLLDAFNDLFDAGASGALIDMYEDGGAIPVDADAALGGATLIVTLTMSAVAFAAATDAAPGATAAAAAITNGTAVASTTPSTGGISFLRIRDSNSLAVNQATVSESGGGGDIIIDNDQVNSGQDVGMSSLVTTLAES